MSKVHVRPIQKTLERLFSNKIDLRDYEKKSQEEKDAAFLTRALAAYAVFYLAGTTADIAAASVVDGYDDNGIDAVHYDEIQNFLWIVQAKWFKAGDGCPEYGEAKKFLGGVRDLLDSNFESFNEKLKSKQTKLELALDNSKTKYQIILAYPGSAISTHIQKDVDSILKELNEPISHVLASFIPLTLKEITASISNHATGKITQDILVKDWGSINEPYKAIYGRMSASDLALIWKNHGPNLLNANIRTFLGDSSVNEAIKRTLQTNPEHFWYFNNGLTILCSSIERKLAGGAKKDSCMFTCSGISIVNGAQTIGAIAEAYASILNDSQKTDKLTKLDIAEVAVRLISLADCPEDFGISLTRAANTQNHIERRDFVSLDPNQDRIRIELYAEGINYIYKTGDSLVANPGFNLDEATSALACSGRDITYAILSKKEIGKLWEDIKAAPYIKLFNDKLSGIKLWRVVQILRLIEAELTVFKKGKVTHLKNIAMHGNRFISYIVFALNRASFGDLEAVEFDIDSLKPDLKKCTIDTVEKTQKLIQSHYPDSMIARFFYNLTKCKIIAKELGVTN